MDLELTIFLRPSVYATLKNMKVLLLRFITFLLLLSITSIINLANPQPTKAQGYLYCRQSIADCIYDWGIQPNPQCEEGYLPPCNDPNADCNTVCQTYAVINGCQNVPCIDPDTTPAPPCPENETCTQAPRLDCQALTPPGTFIACTDPQGNPGTCCEKNEMITDSCTLSDGVCRIPPEACAWNETQIQVACHSSYPSGTICCRVAENVELCPPTGTTGGQCKDACDPNDALYPDINICMSTGQVCCLQNFVPLQGPEVFCKNNDPEDRTNLPDSGRIATAIGCIPVTSTRDFVNFLLGWGVGIAGGIAFILIVAAGIMIVTSAGDPKRVQAGKELLTAAVSGLLLLIFGAFVLEFIGVDILNIPGFGQ